MAAPKRPRLGLRDIMAIQATQPRNVKCTTARFLATLPADEAAEAIDVIDDPSCSSPQILRALTTLYPDRDDLPRLAALNHHRRRATGSGCSCPTTKDNA